MYFYPPMMKLEGETQWSDNKGVMGVNQMKKELNNPNTDWSLWSEFKSGPRLMS